MSIHELDLEAMIAALAKEEKDSEIAYRKLMKDRRLEWQRVMNSPEFKGCKRLGFLRHIAMYSDRNYYSFDLMVGPKRRDQWEQIAADEQGGFTREGKPITADQFIELCAAKIKEEYDRVNP